MKYNMSFCALFCLTFAFSHASLANDSKSYTEASQHCTETIGATLAGVDADSFANSYKRRGMARVGKNIRVTYVLKRSMTDTPMPKRVVCKFDQRKKSTSLKTS